MGPFPHITTSTANNPGIPRSLCSTPGCGSFFWLENQRKPSCPRHLSQLHLPKCHCRLLLWQVDIKLWIFLLSKPNTRPRKTEICYNLHYMTQNGRNRGDPWSLRQTGVYQKSHLSTGTSAWILMQLAADTRAHLEKRLAGRGVSLQNPMQLHTLILLSTARNWTDYLEHLDTQLTELVRTMAPTPSTVPSPSIK